jgi:peptidoglycan L-alanyl-D-glutamate endopeptidase CwlK
MLAANLMSSRNVADLDIAVRAAYLHFDELMKAAGIDYLITCTYRSTQEQTNLYAQGRTMPGNIVTNAQAGQSAHNGLKNAAPNAYAFDIVILRNGKAVWNTSDPHWKIAGECGEKAGLEWAGNWQHFVEFPHFQLPNWKDINNV